jgi:opacity protein-like surface antigen
MNRTHLISLTVAAVTMTVAMASSVNAQERASTPPAKQFSIGPAISSLGFGVMGRVGVADNISIRPFAMYASFAGGSTLGFGAAATYDFKLQDAQFVPYVGAGFAAGSISANSLNGTPQGSIDAGGFLVTAGVDYKISDNMTANVSYGSTLSGVRAGVGFDF